jgi:hypothetical protein
MMSGQDIVFVPSDGLKLGMNAEIMVDCLRFWMRGSACN